VVGALAFLAACRPIPSTISATDARAGADGAPQVSQARASASSAFWTHWGDGKAELSGYAIKTNRYGQMRDGEVVLIYVTEPLDSRTLIKDDKVEEQYKLNVMKLNHALKFRTGIYPYSVMTSTFSPVDDLGSERFAPVKISLTAQEWCGHVYQVVKPTLTSFTSELRSYFASEGETSTNTTTEANTLYEDALLIQLRELDGPFNRGTNWSGRLVPTTWSTRKAHTPLQPVDATITRTVADRGGVSVTRFELKYGQSTRTIDVEQALPRRVLGWSASDGEQAAILKTARLPYWQLNNLGEESFLEQLGLSPTGARN
jgi:hypothetical protein